ncbi:hypothetical protein ACF3NA_08420 [Alkanindiges sp. WGS2144]|uniref:hypothetical protein n=1 Tax=Alkanindiges sp. WGS2144 TaxID=3366808 RepID=UPI0037528185
MLGMKKSIVVGLAGLSLALGACSHLTKNQQTKIQPNKPLVQSNQIYYAPAQSYNLDLDTPALLGKLDLKQSCTAEGNSLSITDQIGRFYRVDAINLNNNPKLPQANEQNSAALTSQLAQFYSQLYQTPLQGNTKSVRSALGASGYAVLSQDNQQVIGLLIHKRGDYAYVLQHTQPRYDEKTMQQALAQLAQNMQIPGRQLKNSTSEMALSIDLAQSTPAQLAAWKKSANCS